ncbi:hypothetical protein BJ741DRAFT_442222 [Chytriomyces cf. hyalinus JEL632]|nr:hypothetical protein BJ741DRAFT_442222 [Chytriomyces cf. hyalinus JEL632]
MLASPIFVLSSLLCHSALNLAFKQIRSDFQFLCVWYLNKMQILFTQKHALDVRTYQPLHLICQSLPLNYRCFNERMAPVALSPSIVKSHAPSASPLSMDLSLQHRCFNVWMVPSRCRRASLSASHSHLTAPVSPSDRRCANEIHIFSPFIHLLFSSLNAANLYRKLCRVRSHLDAQSPHTNSLTNERALFFHNSTKSTIWVLKFSQQTWTGCYLFRVSQVTTKV